MGYNLTMSKAYTLIEIIVVLAVICILSAATLPLVKALKQHMRTLDNMSTIVHRTRTTSQRHQTCTALLIGQGNAIIVRENNDSHKITFSILPKQHERLTVSDEYKPATVVFDKRGHVLIKDITVDGAPYKTSNRLIKGTEARYIHRTMGGLIGE